MIAVCAPLAERPTRTTRAVFECAASTGWAVWCCGGAEPTVSFQAVCVPEIPQSYVTLMNSGDEWLRAFVRGAVGAARAPNQFPALTAFTGALCRDCGQRCQRSEQ
jgi:hypothetical protein